MSGNIVNIAAYKFVELAPDTLPDLKVEFSELCHLRNLKGTILLSPEGINLFLAGRGPDVESFRRSVQQYEKFSDLDYKISVSDRRPFKRMRVKIKDEIISMRQPHIQPSKFKGRRISPKELKNWMDEKRDLTLLDTRNDFEVELGTFTNAQHLHVGAFSSFPEAADMLTPDLKVRPVVLFCTGGIRCEKAAPLLEASGFEQVYQLDGGILRYFEECGSEYFNGECFVFDERVALDGQLRETGSILCARCQRPVTRVQQESDLYHPDKGCPHCRERHEERLSYS